MQNKGKYDGQYKIIVLGDSGVGKTSLLMRYCDDDFTKNHLPTIGIDFKNKNILINDKMIKLQIWDTAGQERFRVITKTYYRAASGIMLTYDVADEDSFHKIRIWMKQIDENAPKSVVKLLVGNKCDRSDRKVSFEDGKNIANSYQMNYFETSAKTNFNITEAFNELVKGIIEINDPTPIVKNNGFDLKNKEEAKETKCCK